MTTKLNFVWSATPHDTHHGLVYIHRADGELMYTASPKGSVEVIPGQYRLRIQIAGREPALSEAIELSGPDFSFDLDKLLGRSSQIDHQVWFRRHQSQISPRLRQTWQVETCTGNLFNSDLKRQESLGLWDGRFPVGLPVYPEVAYTRLTAGEDESVLIAIPASKEGKASLAVIGRNRPDSGNVRDDRTLMRVEPENPSVKMLLSLLASGKVSDALTMAPQLAADLIEPAQKKRDPVAAAIGCDFLLSVVDQKNDPRRLWRRLSDTVDHLEKYESWLPDSAVFAAHMAALREQYEIAAKHICRLEVQGPPILTSRLIKSIELIRLIITHLAYDHPEQATLDRVHRQLVDIAVACEMSEQFLTLRDFKFEGAHAGHDK